MCGIAGVLMLDGRAADPRPVARMTSALAHRGPDGVGVQVDGPMSLGHRRLSILDPTPAGSQPMRRGGLVLVHNGEVYNYRELSAELRQLGVGFVTGTDTEVILAAYAMWGLDAIPRFNGMFAFALWDAARRRLVLARDRFGVKPLHLRRTAHALAFASEVPALLAGRPIDPDDSWVPQPHLGAVHDFLTRGWSDHSPATFVDGMTVLPAAHVLVVESGSERMMRYWGPPELADDSRPYVRGRDKARDEALIGEFRATFDSAVRLRLRSDVAIGTCLSGGLDSSSIVETVAVLRAESEPDEHMQIPSIGIHARFPAQGIDESSYAVLVARHARLRLVDTSPSGYPLLASILPVLRAQGAPYGGASINAQFAVMATARREGVKVLLDGQGADELLGGYDHYLGVRAAGLVYAGRPLDGARELVAQARRGPLTATGALLGAVRGGTPRGAVELARAVSGGRFGVRCAGDLRGQTAAVATPTQPGTYLAARLWHSMSTAGLPTLLRYEDRNSMAFGIEARVPFLDVRLVELAVRLPDRLRIERGVTKAILRRAMAGRLPALVANRRDKLGFAAPQRVWLTQGQPEVVALLRDGQVVQRGWVRPDEVERVIAQGLSGRRSAEQLWRLFITEAWLRLMWPDADGAGGRETWQAGLAAEADGVQ